MGRYNSTNPMLYPLKKFELVPGSADTNFDYIYTIDGEVSVSMRSENSMGLKNDGNEDFSIDERDHTYLMSDESFGSDSHVGQSGLPMSWTQSKIDRTSGTVWGMRSFYMNSTLYQSQMFVTAEVGASGYVGYMLKENTTNING